MRTENEIKATEMAAYFLSKEESGKMEYKKLMGLMYLTERECIKRYNITMSCDDFEAKEHGPVLSETYKLMEGRCESSVDGWNSKINELDGDYISVKERVDLDDTDELWEKLGHLSDADCERMDEIWEEFGYFSEQELRRYIKNNCPEWRSARRSNGLNGRKYEDYENKESFSNQITIDVLYEKMELPQHNIGGLKEYIDTWQ